MHDLTPEIVAELLSLWKKDCTQAKVTAMFPALLAAAEENARLRGALELAREWVDYMPLPTVKAIVDALAAKGVQGDK